MSSSQTIRHAGNRLKDEASLYLRQHAFNPVDWHPWTEEALERAAAENKPIFLSVGYAACHWCHVMEREVFERDDIAALLNEHYVCIKVDREERPDLDAVYMEALQAMTGSGGWPMSLFLTRDQKPFYGATYVPPEQFLQLVERVHTVYQQNRTTIERQAELLSYSLTPNNDHLHEQPLDDGSLDAAAETEVRRLDTRWGGTRGEVKFPVPGRWRYLIQRYRKSGDPRLAQAVRKTLDAMGSGGLQDHLDGGFHRYTVDESWLVPHFEKMLYDNAQLASLYLEAAAVFEEPRYREIARDTLDFLNRRMRAPDGGFFSSLDADSEGQEGATYLWTPAQLRQVAGEADGQALSLLLGVTDAGNFEGRSVLTRRSELAAVATTLQRDPAELAGLLERWRPALREERARRPQPSLDRKVITSWNGLALSAFARGYELLGEPWLAEAADQTADFLRQVHRRPDGGLYRASDEGQARHPAVLGDYANLVNGLFDLFQATQHQGHLHWALELIEQARSRFANPAGGFYMTEAGLVEPLGRREELFDGVRPAGSSAMLHALLRAAALRGSRTYRQQAERMLEVYASLVRRAGTEMSNWLTAAQLLRGPHWEVVIAGDSAQPEGQALLDAVRQLHLPLACLVLVPPEGPDPELAELLPATRGKIAGEAPARAFVCRQGSCLAPTTDPAELRRQLLSGLQV